MSKHTPGPWHIGAGNGVGSVFGPEGHRCQMTDEGTALAPICMMVSGFNGIVHEDRFEPEDQANARLIAAAPELLEALKGAKWLINKMSGWCDNDLSEFDEPAAIYAAIIKATIL